MNKKRTYEAFTLVEMLVVMGILIILMVLGIAAGRFALFRASDVAHRNGADQLAEGLQAYYVDNRAYPGVASCGDTGTSPCTPQLLMEEEEKLAKYMDQGSFNGGSAASYIYLTGGDNNDQAVLVCVSMRGYKSINDGHSEGAYYCAGNGFSVDNMGSSDQTLNGTLVTTSLIETDTVTGSAWDQLTQSFATTSHWDGQVWLASEPT